MRKVLLPLVALFSVLYCACKEDKAPTVQENRPAPSTPPPPQKADTANAAMAASRADWSEVAASGPCLMSEDEIAEALGAPVSKKEVIGETCRYTVGDAWVSISLRALDRTMIDGFVAKIPEQVENGPYHAVDLHPSLPATQRGPLVQLYTDTRLVDVKADLPRFQPEAPTEERKALRAKQADNALLLARALVKKHSS